MRPPQQQCRSVREQLDDLVVVPDLMQAFTRQIETAQKYGPLIALNLADNECAHGRLSSDSTPPCGCWPGETER